LVSYRAATSPGIKTPKMKYPRRSINPPSTALLFIDIGLFRFEISSHPTMPNRKAGIAHKMAALIKSDTKDETTPNMKYRAGTKQMAPVMSFMIRIN
jgi:hypothetical protein